jgi:Intein splicing domain/LAGLIDADG-like domain/Homing endonuclease
MATAQEIQELEAKLKAAKEARLANSGDLAIVPAEEVTLGKFTYHGDALRLQDPIKYAAIQRNLMVKFVQTQMIEGTDFGLIPGVKEKCLFKPGAERLATLFNYSISIECVERHSDYDKGFFAFTYKATIKDCVGRPISECEGNCNSKEKKYAFRWVNERYATPAEKAAALSTKNGSIQIPNDDIYSIVNTLMKMAQKRCLGSTVPLLIKSPRGYVRTDVEGLYESWRKSDGDHYLPGVASGWRKVMGMIKDTGREIYRIDLSDGSYVRATAEHRFPTKNGLKHVSELCIEDELIRSNIVLDKSRAASEDFGWLSGLFIAEGDYSNGCVQFTINADRNEIIDRIVKIAESVGASTSVRKKESHCYSVNCYGPAITGIIKNFVEGELAYGKHLSKQAWRQGKSFLAEILKGYLDGDGSWTEKKGRAGFWRIGFTGKNRQLAADLRALGNLLGFRTQITRSSSKCQGKTFPTFTGWLKPSEQTYNQKSLTKIVSIQKEPKLGTVYDIEVDGDHLFCLADGIQTHNSVVGAVILACNASSFFKNAENLTEMPIPEDRPVWEGQTIDAEILPEPKELSRDWNQIKEWTGFTSEQIKNFALALNLPSSPKSLTEEQSDALFKCVLANWAWQSFPTAFKAYPHAVRALNKIIETKPGCSDSELMDAWGADAARRESEAIEAVPPEPSLA